METKQIHATLKVWSSFQGYNNSKNHDSWITIPLIFTDPKLNSLLVWEICQSEESLPKRPHTKPIIEARLKELQNGKTFFILHTTKNKDAQCLKS